jgi:hypothetical protein
MCTPTYVFMSKIVCDITICIHEVCLFLGCHTGMRVFISLYFVDAAAAAAAAAVAPVIIFFALFGAVYYEVCHLKLLMNLILCCLREFVLCSVSYVLSNVCIQMGSLFGIRG